MGDSVAYKTLLACFDKLVLALRADPVTISNELAAAGLIPPPDGQIEAQQLVQRILDIVKVEPARYDDIVKVFSKHDWLKDIVGILHGNYKLQKEQSSLSSEEEQIKNPVSSTNDDTPSSKPNKEEKHIIENKRTMAGAPKAVKLLSRGGAEAIHTDEIPQLSQWDFPHTSSSLPIPNPIVNLGDLCEDDYENLDAQISDLTVNINKSFKKLQNQVYKSFRQRIDLSSIILTLNKDDVMIFNDLDICSARDMFEVFMKAVYPHCSYFNYELLELLVDIHGSPEDKAHMDKYLGSFTRYCEAMPCAEEICGNGGSDSRRVKLNFKIDLDRQCLKPEILKRIKNNIARHLKIQPCSLYLRSVKEGCVLLEFLIPPFILNRVFPLSNAQKDALHNECKVTAIQCDNPRIHLILGVSKQDSASPDEDSESVCSSQDGAGSVMSEDGMGVVMGGVEEEVLDVDVEFQLGEYIDQLSDKNSRTRLDALVSLNKILSYKMVAHHLLGRKKTLVDIITRNLRRVQGRERCELIQLSTLLIVQFGADHLDVSASLKPTVSQLATDHTVAVQERAKCVILLGVIGFIGAADLYEVEQTLRFCEDLFKKSKRDEVMMASCAQSWSLLLSVAPNHIIPGLFQSLLPVFNTLLDKLEGGGASSMARLAIGQAVAILFELGRDVDPDLLESAESCETYSLIEQLATESNRYTARKERNQLRAHFREVLQTLNDEGAPERTVKVGLESISLDSWSRLIQYNMFRELLGSGMTAHIQGNELLREVFQMGPAPLTTVESKASRLERKYYNAAVAKHRTQSRSKQRDKRTVL